MELECFTLFDPDSLFLYLSSKFKNIQIKALYHNHPTPTAILPRFNPKCTSIPPQIQLDSTPNSSLFNPNFILIQHQIHPDFTPCSS